MHRRPALARYARPGLAGIRRALRRRRRALAMLALLLAAMALLPSLAPAEARTAPVVVAARDLPTGHELVEGDLRMVDVPAVLLPVRALASDEEAVGRRLAAPLPEGSALTSTQLRDGAVALSADQALLAIPIDTALVRHLTPGSRIDLVVPGTDAATPRTIGATAVEIDETAGESAFPETSGAGGSASTVIVVAVEREDAPAIAHATREGWVVAVPVG